MLNWLSSIGDAIGLFVQFIISTITGIISLFSMVGSSFSFITVALTIIPLPLRVFMVAGISIAIVFHLVGR